MILILNKNIVTNEATATLEESKPFKGNSLESGQFLLVDITSIMETLIMEYNLETHEEIIEFVERLNHDKLWISLVTEDFNLVSNYKDIVVTDEFLRYKRKSILKAWDIYKSNVAYGAETETETEHNEILNWYNLLLSLDTTAINNVPSKIKKYMQ